MPGRTILGEYRALEPALWAEVGRHKAAGPLAALTVVAPSGRLVRHLKRAAARRFPHGLVAVRFANLFQFALDLAGAEGRFVAPPILFERILLGWLEGRGAEDSVLGRPTARTYDVAGALHAAVRDLADAGVDPEPGLLIEALRGASGAAASRITELDVRKLGALLAAYRHYARTLARLGVADRAAVLRTAVRHAGGLRDPLLVYGFYDMTQVQADLVAECARHVPVTLLVPHGADPDTWRFGDWFRDTFAPAVTARTERLAPAPAAPVPAVATAVGERDEVWLAAKAARALLDAGCPAGEIALVARTLEPYHAAVREVFTEHLIPVDGSPGRALLDHPLARAAVGFFRATLDGLPRTTVLDVVGHPLFRAPGERRHWALLARALRIGRGADWERLGRFAGSGYVVAAGRSEDEDRRERRVPGAEVRGLRAAVARLSADWPEEAGWRRHAEAHRRALRRAFRLDGLLDEERAVVDALGDVLDTLAALEALAERVPRRAFVEALERECRRRRLEHGGGQGVAVLDAMAARGLSFRHVFLLGMNARVFPRFLVEEPFVSDAVRREVIRVLGHHLPVRADAYDEERLLFHLVCSAATERLVCVYQRADAAGRLRDPSPFLRPLLGGPVDAVPRSERAKRARAGVQTPRELLLAAGDRERALAALGFDALAYRRARAFFARLDGTPAVTEYEGRTGPLGRRRGVLSATRLERFATCPFQYFAAEVLRLFPPEEATDGDLSPRETGSLVHATLERLYRGLAARGFRGERLDVEVERAAAEAAAELERREGLALTGLLAARLARIRRVVGAYAAWDLAHLEGWEPFDFEAALAGELAGLPIQGTLDRLDRNAATGELRVIDYKLRHGTHWETKLDTQAVQGKRLQGPFYLALAATRGPVTEAAFHFIENHALEDPSLEAIRERRLVKRFTDAQWQGCRDEVEAAVAAFVALIDAGWFFVRVEDKEHGHCRRCDFRTVCRKAYGRVRWKPAHAPEAAAYWRIVRP